MSHTRFKADAITNRDITSYGNITGKYIFGNGAFLTGLDVASIPSIVSADIRGNMIGNYANVANIIANTGNVGNVRMSGGNIAASGQVNITGNVIAPFFFGNGLGLSGVLTINTAEIIADIFGNITSSGTITTSGNFYAGSISGDGSNITNIALSSIQPGDLYRDVFGNITGTSGAFSGNVSCATVLASNIQAGNVQGIFNVAYSNLITSPFNLSAQNASNLFIRNGLSTTVMLRTDGVAVVSNGAAYRFGTNDFDKGVLTNGSDGQYGAGTLTGDLIVHNTKTNARTCLASSYGTPELTVFNGNIGIRTTNPNVALDVNGSANVGALTASNIQSGNIQGIFTVAYSNLDTSPFNFQAQSGANLVIRSGASTMALLRTDGVAVVSNGAAFRFGTADFDKGMFTNATANQYANLTSVGDLVVHNTKTDARTCVASSYGRPEITVWNGNTGILTTSPAVALDINGDANVGNITAAIVNVSGNLNVNGAVIGSYFSGSGSGLQNIPSSSLAAGDLFKNISGDLTGNYCNVAIVNATQANITTVFATQANITTVFASNIQAGNIQGVFNVAYSNLTTSPFNLSASTAANLFIRNGLSTTVMLRTDGVAVVSNGAAYRFGLNDFDKGVLTNGSDNQYATGTLTGDLIVHNTKTNARTCMASSYGRPEITVLNGNTGILTTNPNVALDVNGEANVGNLGAISMYLSSPTTAVNIIQVGGTRVDITNTNVAGLGRDLRSLRINTLTGNTVEFYSGGVRTANISPNGNLIIAGPDAIKATGSTWTNPSDRRLKDNIITANLDDCIQIVRNLDLKSFSWKDNRQEGNVLGWIAQEVELVLPKSITTTDMFGLTDCKILNADQLYVNMYGALKKSIQMIDTLRTEVETLKTEVEALKSI